MNCEARQYSDQMQCACGLVWDMNDDDPPPCPGLNAAERNAVVAARTLNAIRESLNDGT